MRESEADQRFLTSRDTAVREGAMKINLGERPDERGHNVREIAKLRRLSRISVCRVLKQRALEEQYEWSQPGVE